MILHEIFHVVSRFPRYISCYIEENRFTLWQCTAHTVLYTPIYMRKNHISSHPNWYVQYCCKIYITHDKMQYILLPLHLYSKLFSKVINAAYFKSFFLFVRIFLAQKRSGNQCGCYLSSNYIILFNPPTAIYWAIFLFFLFFISFVFLTTSFWQFLWTTNKDFTG